MKQLANQFLWQRVQSVIFTWRRLQREYAVRRRPNASEKELLANLDYMKRMHIAMQTSFGEQIIILESELQKSHYENQLYLDQKGAAEDALQRLQDKVIRDTLKNEDVIDSVVNLRSTVARLERISALSQNKVVDLEKNVADSQRELKKAEITIDRLERQLKETNFVIRELQAYDDDPHSKVSHLATGLISIQSRASQREKEVEEKLLDQERQIAELRSIADRALAAVIQTPRSKSRDNPQCKPRSPRNPSKHTEDVEFGHVGVGFS